MDTLALPALITVMALATYQTTTFLVGRARVSHGVKPPATTGPEAFERTLRVQQNTLEQLVFFLPAFWLAVLFSSTALASLLGAVWVAGRIAYALGYLEASEHRVAGFVISLVSGLGLLAMALVGALQGF